jgi:uncharacterized membrane protein YciS (DUF1049 family)
MNFKVFLRTIVFLAILFTMLYVGMTNTQKISFAFPLLTDKPVTAPAAIVYFIIFAVGVVAGTMFHLGGGGAKKS